MSNLTKRVLYRFAGKLKMGPGRVDPKATASLRGIKKLPKRNQGDLSGAIMSAGAYAQSMKHTMYVYPGNSYGHMVWRVSDKPSEYLNPINNTGTKIVSVTPELEVAFHDTERPTVGAGDI